MSTTLLPERSSRLTRLGRGLIDQLTFPHGSTGYTDAYRPAVAAGRIGATVEAITPRSHRANSITLRPDVPLAFAPGQHVLLTTQINGARQTRCYSLSDTPHRADGRLEVTVAHLPDGLVSSHLTGPLQVGESIGVSAPQGHDFILPRVRPSRLILISGGSGITPLRSMWRTMAHEGLADRVTVLAYARTADDVIFADELAQIGATVVLTRSPDGPGRFTADHLDQFGIDPVGATTFVCGPAGLVTAVADHWATLDDAPLFTESFAPAVAPTDPANADGMLTFARSGASAANSGGTLLDQAEAAGLTPEAGCRMGICHTCTTTKHAGVVRDVRTGQASTDGECEIQLCISTPVGDVALDL